MKDKKFKLQVAYTSSFISFVLPKIDVEEIILFGSVARGEANEESDIDIFFNVSKNEEEIKRVIKQELEKFHKSSINDLWSLKGIKNEINIEVGNLNQWKLKRSIISDGIVLYGKYKTLPEKTKGFMLFALKPIKNIAKRNKIIRYIFGRQEEKYKSKGLIEQSNGKKLSTSVFLLPLEKAKEIDQFLNEERASFSFFELWTDQIS